MSDPVSMTGPRRDLNAFVLSVCLVAALGGLLFGYDTAVIAGAIGFLRTHFELNPISTGWVASCALLGCVVGAAAAGPLADLLGRRTVLVISAWLFLVSALGTALPRDVATFVFFRILGGIAVGAASMTSPLYIAEITPPRVRGTMVTTYQLAIVVGILTVYFVNYFIAYGQPEEWNTSAGWRWMFGSEALPATLFLFLLYLVPESPRWLAKQGNSAAALEILARVTGTGRAEAELEEIQSALKIEEASFGQIFRPGLRKALFLGVGLAVLQQATGINVFMYYAPEIFKQLGSTTDSALLQTVLVGLTNLTFTFVAIWAIDRFGRKPLLILGAVGMTLAHLMMGHFNYTGREGLGVVIFTLVFIASFASSFGPVCWVIISEIYPTRIRGRAMAAATLSLWLTNYGVSQTFPMLNENATLVRLFRHAFPFWLYGSMCLIALFFTWRLLPETKGRSLEEIERWWIATGK